MKTLLLNLSKNIDNRFDYDQVAQPLGLASISSFMKKQGLDVELLDAHAFHLTRKKILNNVMSLRPDIVGLSVMTYQLPTIISFLSDLKSVLPEVKVILGGPHVNVEYISTFRSCKETDIIVMGEGEYTMVDLVNAIREGRSLADIRGIAYRVGDEVKVTEHKEFIEDISVLPYPDWDSLPIGRYWDVFTTKKNYARVFASRGCPYSCTFCSAPEVMGRKIRRRTPEHIVGELKLLHDKFHVREVLFNDSTFNIDNQWVSEICENILKMNRSIIWRCNVRADRLDRDTLKLMKKSGCVKVIMGVESADEEMLRSMEKGENLEQIKRGMDILKKVKMPSDHGFILGMPGETKESIQKTITFAKEIKSSVVTFSLATPFPGTKFYEQAKSEGLRVDDWSKFDFYGIPYVPKSMTKKELQDCYKNAVKQFYFRPVYLFKRLLEMRSLTNLRINLWYAFRLLHRKFKLDS